MRSSKRMGLAMDEKGVDVGIMFMHGTGSFSGVCGDVMGLY